MSALLRYLHAAWLRMKLRAAGLDVQVLLDEYATAPVRLQLIRQYMAELQARIDRLEGRQC